MNGPEGPGPARRVVIGIGNPYRGDDGAGPEAARRVRAGTPASVEVVEHDGEPAGLLDLWDNAEIAIVVDAVRSDGVRSDGVRSDGVRSDGRDPRLRFHRLELDADAGDSPVPSAVSSHGVGPGDAVELARVLGRLPRRLVLYGIEGVNFEPGLGLSPEVEAATSVVADRIVKEVSG
ncbi:MAG TPA: hydrogenase maturation protease [Acidimicrobiales bacterium]|nr:hydrogenase maturation protease [Acidimicrobiales bacterium]